MRVARGGGSDLGGLAMLVHCNLAPAPSHIRIKPARGLLAARELYQLIINH